VGRRRTLRQERPVDVDAVLADLAQRNGVPISPACTRRSDDRTAVGAVRVPGHLRPPVEVVDGDERRDPHDNARFRQLNGRTSSRSVRATIDLSFLVARIAGHYHVRASASWRDG
jgi:hypothetical protein